MMSEQSCEVRNGKSGSLTIKGLNASFDFMKPYIVFGGGSLLGACIDYVGTLVLNDALEIAPWIDLGLAMFLRVIIMLTAQ